MDAEQREYLQKRYRIGDWSEGGGRTHRLIKDFFLMGLRSVAGECNANDGTSKRCRP
jgi:hypothetical protein